ncbi:hypothetical protein IWQ60_003530 [Tieghemiomyces parasiticus]|uniref:Membrane insertase YidC/Oxa/ALB C-terminal domain-containing protein n=1 Tax=Tieghemiomyces parasiticus TaxID=78921 RepID=A0A9W8DWD3_9FUNG|nr:hypothetical protein IWQ60_003530 [Tieghemiomyces parasiticus]
MSVAHHTPADPGAIGIPTDAWQLDPEAAYHAYANIPFIFEVVQGLLVVVHNNGVPWWATFIVGAVALRTTIAPIAIYQQQAIGRQLKLQPVVKLLGDSLKYTLRETGRHKGWGYDRYKRELSKEFSNRVVQMYMRNNCSPLFRMVLPFVQIPIFAAVSFTIRRMCGQPLPWFDTVDHLPPVAGLATEGVLWFTDLLVPDPTFILPLVLGVTHLVNIQLNLSLRSQGAPLPKYYPYLINGFRGLAVLMTYVATQIPAALCLYWTTSALFSTGLNLAFRSVRIRRLLRIYTPDKSVAFSQKPSPV